MGQLCNCWIDLHVSETKQVEDSGAAWRVTCQRISIKKLNFFTLFSSSAIKIIFLSLFHGSTIISSSNYPIPIQQLFIMKSFTSCAVALATLLSITSASPTGRAQLAARSPTYEYPTSVQVTLRGATPEASYCLDVPLNAPYGSPTSTSKLISPTVTDSIH